MGIFDSKNDIDNKNHSDGYVAGRSSQDPISSITDSLFGDFYGKEWKDGYKEGKSDKYEHGSKD
jgi:hypothetical protein